MIADFLRTERLYLMKMKGSDASHLFKIWSDPVVTRFMNIMNYSNESQAKEMIQLLDELAAQGKAIRYSIFETKTNQIIGSCGFNSLDYKNSKAEIGYELDHHFWGKGYGSEAIACLVNYAFGELEFTRIEAIVEPKNTNSIKLLQKLGFKFDGTLKNKEKEKSAPLNIYSRLNID